MKPDRFILSGMAPLGGSELPLTGTLLPEKYHFFGEPSSNMGAFAFFILRCGWLLFQNGDIPTSGAYVNNPCHDYRVMSTMTTDIYEHKQHTTFLVTFTVPFPQTCH